MANVFTAKNHRPRTIYFQTYINWNDEVSKWRTLSKSFYRPHLPLWPLPPFKRFRPMPPTKPNEPEPDREKPHERSGLKTPEQSFHFGYKHFHRDPSTKKLRELDAEKPLPYPLDTEFRVQFQNPNHLPHLMVKQNIERYGLPVGRRPAQGPVPRVISIPHKDYEDDQTWQRDCHTQP